MNKENFKNAYDNLLNGFSNKENNTLENSNSIYSKIRNLN